MKVAICFISTNSVWKYTFYYKNIELFYLGSSPRNADMSPCVFLVFIQVRKIGLGSVHILYKQHIGRRGCKPNAYVCWYGWKGVFTKILLIMLIWGGVSKKIDWFCNKRGICLIFSSKMHIYLIYIYTYNF